MEVPPIQRTGRMPLLAAMTAVGGDEAAGDGALPPARTAPTAALAALRTQLVTQEDLLDVSRLLVYNAVVTATAQNPAGGTLALHDALAAPLRLNYDAFCSVRAAAEVAGGAHKRLADLMTAALYLKVRLAAHERCCVGCATW